MKKYILTLIIILIISCDYQGPPKKYNFNIVNNSNHTVEIIPYDFDQTKRLQNKLILPPGAILNKIESITEKRYKYSFEQLIEFYTGIGYISKIDFVYKNLRKTNFVVNQANIQEDRNIFSSIFNIGQNQIYTITNADYDAAVDCGGNCN